MTETKKKHGGKREGAGRPMAENDYRKMRPAYLTDEIFNEILADYKDLGEAVRDLWRMKKDLRK